jgi:hypothetical protein
VEVFYGMATICLVIAFVALLYLFIRFDPFIDISEVNGRITCIIWYNGANGTRTWKKLWP